MEFLIFTIPFFIYLYMLYKNSKDDYVLLRRGIKIEEIFDIAVVAVILGLAMSKIFPGDNSYYLSFYIIATSFVLYFYSRRKKLPFGRLLDLFSIAFLTALPLWLVLVGIFAKAREVVGYLIIALIFLIMDVVCIKYYLPKIMNRTMPDGRVGIYFVCVFSSIYLIYSLLTAVFFKTSLLYTDTILLGILFVGGVSLLVRTRVK
jgi:hypothetical protein